MYGDQIGSRVLTGGTTLVPVGFGGRVFNVNIVTGGTTGRIQFFTSGSGVTLVLQEDGSQTVDYGVQGQQFADGIYFYPSGAFTQATVAFKKEQSNT